jgi:glycosyltransferase involved in cell wall biosynthesis
MLTMLAWVALITSAIPAWLFRVNLRRYQPPPVPPSGELRPRVSVLIPARNEERSIRAAVEAVLASAGVELEVIVLDDHSDDSTAPIVRQLAATNSRVRLLDGPELPDGWCGKQYACCNLAKKASFDLLLFLDADVRVAPAGLARIVAFLEVADIVPPSSQILIIRHRDASGPTRVHRGCPCTGPRVAPTLIIAEATEIATPSRCSYVES